jgi:hypothetical protein
VTTHPPTHILDADRRLSRSLLWQIQRRYFRQNGMKAWQEDVVPHAISSSPVMARAYAQVVLGYLRDLAAARQTGFTLDPERPVYVVELGAGSGRLAHHFLHQFHALLADSPFAGQKVVYVMTDFVPEIRDFWQTHPKFQPWVEAGLLDFAEFDVLAPRPLSLHHAARTLDPERPGNPLILIANYFFDSIPQDSFAIEEGQLCDNLLTLYSSRPEPDLADPALWERLELAYEAIPLAEPCYETAVYNDILDDYEAVLPDTVLTFPNVGLDCLRFWQGSGDGRVLLLTADRGYTLLDSLVGQDDPLPNLHGSFSLMVNYHAIGEYVRRSGGMALHPPQYQNHVQVAAYLLGDLPQDGLETRLAFAQAVAQGGPDDFFALQEGLRPHLDTLSLPQLLSYLRLSAWDGEVFRDCFPALLARVEQADPVWYGDVTAALAAVWRQYLPLREDDELAEMHGRLLAVMA